MHYNMRICACVSIVKITVLNNTFLNQYDLTQHDFIIISKQTSTTFIFYVS